MTKAVPLLYSIKSRMMSMLLFSVFHTLLSFWAPDTKANSILDKTQIQYKKMGGMEVFFEYELFEKGKSVSANKGQLLTKDNKYRLILNDFEVYNNAKVQYTYLKKNKEVQITDPDESENKYQPAQLAAIHTSGTHQAKYIKALKSNGKISHVIELTPVSKTDPISKITLSISDKTKLIERAEWQESSGNKTQLVFTKTVASRLIDNAAFEFKPETLKGVHIEDLRDE